MFVTSLAPSASKLIAFEKAFVDNTETVVIEPMPDIVLLDKVSTILVDKFSPVGIIFVINP